MKCTAGWRAACTVGIGFTAAAYIVADWSPLRLPLMVWQLGKKNNTRSETEFLSCTTVAGYRSLTAQLETVCMCVVISRSDCMQILTRCLDVSRAALGVTPSAICDRLSTPDDISPRCLSLSSYLGQYHCLPSSFVAQRKIRCPSGWSVLEVTRTSRQTLHKRPS